MIKSLSVDLILTDLGTQMRAQVDDDVVEHYAELWKQDHAFPPLDVFDDGERIILADGFHRLYGAKASKRASIKCDVHPGTLREAILFACGANDSHGLHRSRKDKRAAVETLLDDGEWGKRSARWVAEQCKVSHGFVLTIIAERKPRTPPESPGGNVTGTEPKRERLNGKDGKNYPKAIRAGERGEVCASKDEFDTAKMDAEKKALAVDASLALDERIKQQNSIIEAFAKRIMKAFTDEVPADPWLDESRLNIAKDQIKSACSTIRLAKACDKPCPKCEGKGCKTCRQCGYLPTNSYEMAGGK